MPENLQLEKFLSVLEQPQQYLIIGDVMVDAYIFGRVERISPEAPVPVVSVTKRDHRPGGAANVAMNILSLGHQPILCSIIGEDEKANVLLHILEQNGISTEGILKDEKRLTTTKFRVIGNNVQMLRVDEETTTFLDAKTEQIFIEKIRSLLLQHSVRCVIFQDYDKGCITPGIIEKIISFSREKNIPVIVDPKKRNFFQYRHVTLFKPNLKEFSEGIKEELPADNLPLIKQKMENFANAQNIEQLMVTMSERGICIYDRTNNDFHHIPADVRQVADVSGAGDTVLSVAAICTANNLNAYTTAYIANLAGAIVCQYVGVVPVQHNELTEVIKSKLNYL